MTILVSPLSRVSQLVVERKPARVISVLDPGVPFSQLGPAYSGRHLRLAFHDAHSPMRGITVPTVAHIDRLVAFLDECSENELLLIHCHAGIGRSTATGFVAACHRYPRASEWELAVELRRIAPLARPNERLVALADDVMQRGGRMASAIAETGRGLAWVDVSEGVPFEL
jgi:predicted protein tyrosine phosphatase